MGWVDGLGWVGVGWVGVVGGWTYRACGEALQQVHEAFEVFLCPAALLRHGVDGQAGGGGGGGLAHCCAVCSVDELGGWVGVTNHQSSSDSATRVQGEAAAACRQGIHPSAALLLWTRRHTNVPCHHGPRASSLNVLLASRPAAAEEEEEERERNLNP